MGKVYILLADGFEEIEGLTCVDLMRRAGIDIEMISVSDSLTVKGARGISVLADGYLKDVGLEGDMVILPGGMPGTNNLKENESVRIIVRAYHEAGKYVAAICAAPTVLAYMGLLEGRKATCYPGLEDKLTGAEWPGESLSVVVDENIITSRGLGTAIDFALKLIELLIDKDKADEIAKSVVYK
ncbi:MAG: DJ-1/PfpI family protein [Eubacterium sp.]|nr:DJ-1/PfpI family protein [Eubacterium sp.]